MSKSWNDLTAGDNLYLLVPIFDDREQVVSYEYQNSKVINVKQSQDNFGISIKFKYTNNDGYRKRCIMFIPKNRYDVSVLSDNNCHYAMRPYNFGDLLVSYKSVEDLNYVFKSLITNKQKEIENLIKSQQTFLNHLEMLKNKI